MGGNPSAPPNTLTALAQNPQPQVRTRHSHCPSARSPTAGAHGAVGLNPSTPPDTLTALAQDPDRMVHSAVGQPEHPTTPSHCPSAKSPTTGAQRGWQTRAPHPTPSHCPSARSPTAGAMACGGQPEHPTTPSHCPSAKSPPDGAQRGGSQPEHPTAPSRRHDPGTHGTLTGYIPSAPPSGTEKNICRRWPSRLFASLPVLRKPLRGRQPLLRP